MDPSVPVTTFVPKKPVVEVAQTPTVTRPASLFMNLAVGFFVITALVAVGVYFWNRYALQQLQTSQDSVAKIEKRFEPELITQLQKTDRQLRNAHTVLKQHTVVSPLFDLLEATTIRGIRYTKMDVVFDETKGPNVKLSGEADGYPSIAQQATILGESTSLKDIIFSNFFLTTKGKVSFDVTMGLRSEFVDFEKASTLANTAQASL